MPERGRQTCGVHVFLVESLFHKMVARRDLAVISALAVLAVLWSDVWQARTRIGRPVAALVRDRPMLPSSESSTQAAAARSQRSVDLPRNRSRAMVIVMPRASEIVRRPRVFVLTFSDKKDSLYLHTLAASVAFFNDGEPLHVLGLSWQRLPKADNAGRWRIERRASSGGPQP